MIQYLETAAKIIGYIGTLGGMAVALWKIWKSFREGMKCLLRMNITDIYYHHANEEAPTLREYERKNLDALYAFYKACHGNTFVDDIYTEMRGWKVVS